MRVGVIVDTDSYLHLPESLVVGDKRRVIAKVNLGAFEAELAAFLFGALADALALAQEGKNFEDGGFARAVAPAEHCQASEPEIARLGEKADVGKRDPCKHIDLGSYGFGRFGSGVLGIAPGEEIPLPEASPVVDGGYPAPGSLVFYVRGIV
jgi:hypothetical protein